MNEGIPRLILQPVVENAIVHGLEPKMGSGLIKITGKKEGDENIIVVEDDGVGMPNESMLSLQHSLNSTLKEDMGCGIWNVNQRLKYRFGDQANLTLSHSRHATGLSVTLRWNSIQNDEVASDETNTVNGRRADALNEYDGDRLGFNRN
jgi:two-component system, sensor histidine kinase YesM